MRGTETPATVRARMFTKGSSHMKQFIQGVLVTSALVLGGTSLAADPKPMAAPAKGGTGEYHGFMVPADAKAFLERVHHANQDEIAQAKLADSNSQKIGRAHV